MFVISGWRQAQCVEPREVVLCVRWVGTLDGVSGRRGASAGKAGIPLREHTTVGPLRCGCSGGRCAVRESATLLTADRATCGVPEASP